MDDINEFNRNEFSGNEFNENEFNESDLNDAEDIDKYFKSSEILKTSEKSEDIKNSEICLKCKGTGIVKEKDGSVHVCWDCLNNGKLDVHSKNVKESGLRI
jgi:DnaJ-class molecular chaperone